MCVVMQVIHQEQAKLLIMIMEYLPGGTINPSTSKDRYEPMSEAAALLYFRHVQCSWCSSACWAWGG